MEDLKKHLAVQERSGQSISEHCREHGLSPQSLYYRRRRLAQKGNFVEVGGTGAAGLELKIGEELSIIVPQKFDAARLQQLLQPLGC